MRGEFTIALTAVALAAAQIGLTATAGERGLTLEQARYIIASSGFNPGTVRSLGDAGRYMLRSVSVAGGGHDFVIRVRVDRLD